MILWQVIIEEDPDVPGYVAIHPRRIENGELPESVLSVPTPAEELVLTNINEYVEASVREDTFLITASNN